MSTIIVRPTDIYTLTTFTLYPATIVGSGSIWADDDPTTYAAITGSDPASTQTSTARGHIADGTFSDLVGVAGAELYVGFRLTNVNDVDYSATGNFGFGDDAGSFVAFAQSIQVSDLLAGMDADGWIDFGPFTQAGIDAGNLNANQPPYNLGYFSNTGTLDDAWTATTRYVFVTGGGRTDEADGTTTLCFDVLEARLTVVADVVVGTSQPNRAPQRLYPRAGARRWPPPGSDLTSPRRVGGYR